MNVYILQNFCKDEKNNLNTEKKKETTKINQESGKYNVLTKYFLLYHSSHLPLTVSLILIFNLCFLYCFYHHLEICFSYPNDPLWFPKVHKSHSCSHLLSRKGKSKYLVKHCLSISFQDIPRISVL